MTSTKQRADESVQTASGTLSDPNESDGRYCSGGATRPAATPCERAAGTATAGAPQLALAGVKTSSGVAAESRAPLVTMHSTSRMHPELLAALAARTFDLRPLERWEHLFRACDDPESGAILLDLDEAERSPSLRALGLSAHRLIHLLARTLAHHRVALVVLTSRDYVEIEDLVRAGVHALLHPGTDVERCAEQVRQAVARRSAIAADRSAGRSTTNAQRDVVQPSPQIQRAETHDADAAQPEPITEPIPVVSVAIPVAS